MPRLNIYIPDDLDLALRSHPRDINISQVCAAAIREELATSAQNRTTEWLFGTTFDEPGATERQLMARFGLRRAVAAPLWREDDPARDVVALWTSEFMDWAVSDRLQLAVGGGEQIWSVVRRLEQRDVGLPVWAIGFGAVDRERPHLHPNALATLISLLYAPRARAELVGSSGLAHAWHLPTLLPEGQGIQRLIIGSCAVFDADSPYARVLGDEITDFLVEEHVVGDFLGVFLTADGRAVEPYTRAMTVSHIPAADLRALARRKDTMVLLTAGGKHKARLIRLVMESGLCNSLITDTGTAEVLLGTAAAIPMGP